MKSIMNHPTGVPLPLDENVSQAKENISCVTLSRHTIEPLLSRWWHANGSTYGLNLYFLASNSSLRAPEVLLPKTRTLEVDSRITTEWPRRASEMAVDSPPRPATHVFSQQSMNSQGRATYRLCVGVSERVKTCRRSIYVWCNLPNNNDSQRYRCTRISFHLGRHERENENLRILLQQVRPEESSEISYDLRLVTATCSQ